MLRTRPFPLLLDLEPINADDSELTAARRLLQRVFNDYPRAFDVVVGDALYTDAATYKLIRDHGKHAISVLKRNAAEPL